MSEPYAHAARHVRPTSWNSVAIAVALVYVLVAVTFFAAGYVLARLLL